MSGHWKDLTSDKAVTLRPAQAVELLLFAAEKKDHFRTWVEDVGDVVSLLEVDVRPKTLRNWSWNINELVYLSVWRWLLFLVIVKNCILNSENCFPISFECGEVAKSRSFTWNSGTGQMHTPFRGFSAFWPREKPAGRATYWASWPEISPSLGLDRWRAFAVCWKASRWICFRLADPDALWPYGSAIVFCEGLRWSERGLNWSFIILQLWLNMLNWTGTWTYSGLW